MLGLGLKIPSVILQRLSTPSPLLNGLVSFWVLNEESGTRNDSIGTYHLEDMNTVGFAAGKSGNAASFVSGNSEYFRYATNYVGPSGDMTISLWHYNDTTVAQNPMIFAHTNSSTTANYRVAIRWIQGSRVYRCYISSGSYVQVDSAAVAAGTNWHNIIFSYDSTTKKWTVYVDNGAGVTSSALGAARMYSAASLYVGCDPYYGYATQLVDEVGVWSRYLSSDERTTLQTKFYPTFA